QVHYDASQGREHVSSARVLFTREFFAARADQGAPDPDPIFIVGLPPAGSTLIEQILASHSQVEGTMELPDIPAMAHAVGARGSGGLRYPGALGTPQTAELRAPGGGDLPRRP